MGDTLVQDRFAMPEPFLGSDQFPLKLLEIGSTKVLQFTPLEQIPDAFLRIQLGSVGWQAFQMDTLGPASSQKILDGLRAMNARPVPDHQELAWDFAQEQLQEAHHIWSLERVVLNVHDQTSIGGETTNRREMIASQGNRQDRRLPYRCIGPHGHGQQVKARFVYKDNRTILCFGLFFSSTEWWSRQTWIASSLRWLARVSGFCRLCLIACRRREQWVG